MKRIVKLFVLVLFLFLSENVQAGTITERWCSDEKVIYEVSYNEKYVSFSDINFENIKLGYVKGHENDPNYKFEIFKTMQSCSESNGVVTVCPKTSSIAIFNDGAKYSKDNLLKNKLINVSFNLGRNGFDITISKELTDKYYIRKSPTLNEDKDVDSRNVYAFSKNYYPNSQFVGSNNRLFAKIGEPVILEYYQKGGECDGTVLASQYFQMDYSDDIKVDNPALTDSNSTIYKMCDNYVRKNPDYPNDSISINVKKGVVPICYKKDDVEESEANKITIDEYNNLNVNDVINAKATLDKLLLGVSSLGSSSKFDNTYVSSSNSCSSGSGQVKCDNSTSGSETYNAYSNKNFLITCTDSYGFKGDKAKLTYAGGGFEYGSGLNYSLVRKCQIKFIGKPAVRPIQCTGYECTVVTEYKGKKEIIIEYIPSAGPNEDFDACVTSCDGGQYTQKCINSCYEKVYGTDTKRNELVEKMNNYMFENEKNKMNSLLKYENKNYTISKVATHVLPNGVPIVIPDGYYIGNIREGEWKSNLTSSDRYGYYYDLFSPSGVYLGEGRASTNYCATHSGKTEWSCWEVPAGCIWNADEVYQQRVDAIRADHRDALSKMDGFLANMSVGNVELTIVDSYLKNNNGQFYSFSVNNYNSNLGLNLGAYSYGGESAIVGSAKIGELGDSVKLTSISAVVGVNGVNIDADSYIGKEYGNVAYKTGNRAFTINKNNGSYGLNYLGGFNSSDYYKVNGNANYFTSLFSSNKNVKMDPSGKVSLNLDCYNIELSVHGLGTSDKNYSFSNSCYYGVYNNYVVRPDPPCTGGSGSCPSSSDEGKNGSIRYIFRPIELTDVFPDRAPRWNWTNSASLNLNGSDPYLGYNVNPIKTTEHIESSGHKILADANGELDYEIILDRQGIARIKRYNKDMGSYTNFDMNCMVRGVRLCKSNFLDSAMYIKNAGSTRVNATIGTNND